MRWAWLALSALAAAGSPAFAQTQAPAPARPAAAPDPAQEASKSAFERLDDAERRAIQNDLIWSGDFNGVAGGEFGRRTYDAIIAFERRGGLGADGVLTPPERARLKQAAEAARAAVRFAPVTDPATGVRIGLPQGLLTQRVAVENGVVWRRADGLMSIQLGSYPQGATLAGLFEQMRADGPGRKVTYRLQRPDWFVVSGEEGPRRFYTRVAAGPQGLRGYTFRYPAAEAASADRLMIAIANSFEPFPGAELAVNPARQPQGSAPGAASASPPPLIQPTLAAGPARHAISAVAIGAGRVLTSAAALAGCAGPSLGGRPFDAAAAQVTGPVAVLPAPGAPQRAAAFALTQGSTADSAPAWSLSFDGGEARAVMLSPVRIEGEGAAARVRSAAQAGAGGAPLVDRQGRVAGLIAESPRGRRQIAGVTPEASFPLVTADALAAALRAAGVAPQTEPRTLADAGAAVVEIRCAR